MSFTDDPERDYAEYCRQQDMKLERLPKCAHCGDPIQDDYAIEYEGELYCEECFDFYIKDTMKVPVEVD